MSTLRRPLAALGAALSVAFLSTACTGSKPPDVVPTTSPVPSATATAWNGFTAAEDFCARLDWSRLTVIDSTATSTTGTWTASQDTRRTIACDPELNSPTYGSGFGSLLVTATIHDSAALAEAELENAGEDFGGASAIELAPWTQSRLYKNGVDIQFTGRAENLIVRVNMFLGANLVELFDEDQLATIATGLAEDAHVLCKSGS